jgi:hypothetical protein
VFATAPTILSQLFLKDDITYSTMDRRKLDKLEAELDAMRHKSVKAADVQSLANRLGRNLVKRGKEPNWANSEFPNLRPLSIPDHGGGRDLSPRVRKSVLNELENDIDAWDQKLIQEENQQKAAIGKGNNV